MEISLDVVFQYLVEHFPQFIAADTLIVALIIEKSKTIKFNPISWVGRKIGDWLTVGVKEWVKENNGQMETRLESRITGVEKRLEKKIASVEQCIDERIDDVKETVEQYRDEGVQRDLVARADYYHDEILLQADKMRGGKIPHSERGAQLYRKVLWYEHFTEEHPEYENGVCDLACEYIKRWFRETYMNKKEVNTNEDNK